ncbi:MAG: hypothetical protein IPP88_19615 [Betaproteobacteria bacterium]|nr:hypothetical protein [Betaproteobacteria bacterium]
MGTDTLAGGNVLYLPLTAPMRARSVLGVRPRIRDGCESPKQPATETFASLIAIALERVHYVEVAREAILKMESERLRNSVLALSHDLRTPLTALIGMADAMARSEPACRKQISGRNPFSPESAALATGGQSTRHGAPRKPVMSNSMPTGNLLRSRGNRFARKPTGVAAA